MSAAAPKPSIRPTRPSRRPATSLGADVYAISTTAGQTDEWKNAFAGTTRITLAQHNDVAPTLELFAEMPHRVSSRYDEANDTAIYLWGRAAHASVVESALLSWCANIARSNDPTRLRELLGHFVICIDDRR